MSQNTEGSKCTGGFPRCRVMCAECGELQADTDDGLFDKEAAHRRAGFHEGVNDGEHYCTVEVVEQELTPQEAWEQHNESFQYEPPELPAEAWSSEHLQEIVDRVINRRVQWMCQKCTGCGPFSNLRKARNHVESHHSTDLVEKHAIERDEQEAAADGGRTWSERREKNNQQLTEWSE